MIGIYKITNKLNGKSYIGQSIHCGKRFDEHNKGKQLIDEVIQIEGAENFNFEILKEVDKKYLSYWEDYYIMKYNTMFPKGYNKKWNCNKVQRKQIQDTINKEKQIDIIQNSIKYKNKNIINKSQDIMPQYILEYSTRLYIYLLKLSLNNNMIFTNKMLNLTEIQNATELTDKTIKLYFYYLENNNIIKYNGNIKTLLKEEIEEIDNKIKDVSEASKERKRNEYISFLLWKKRRKYEKTAEYSIVQIKNFDAYDDSIYSILNKDYNEIDTKVFLFTKTILNNNFTLSDFREACHLVNHYDMNTKIKQSISKLNKNNIISCQETTIINKYGTEIPYFTIYK